MACSVDPVFVSVRFYRGTTLIAALSLADNDCLANDYIKSLYTGECINATEYSFTIKTVKKQHEGESWVCQGVAGNSTTAFSNCITIHVTGVYLLLIPIYIILFTLKHLS